MRHLFTVMGSSGRCSTVGSVVELVKRTSGTSKCVSCVLSGRKCIRGRRGKRAARVMAQAPVCAALTGIHSLRDMRGVLARAFCRSRCRCRSRRRRCSGVVGKIFKETDRFVGRKRARLVKVVRTCCGGTFGRCRHRFSGGERARRLLVIVESYCLATDLQRGKEGAFCRERTRLFTPGRRSSG